MEGPVANYCRLLDDVAEECVKSGRDPAEVKVVAVSKRQSLAAIDEVYLAGCRDFGENYLQESLEKIEAFPDIDWHFIGNLQRKKVARAAGKFVLVHAVDSLPLAQKISQSGVDTSILLEVNTSGEESKHGFTPDAIIEVVSDIMFLPNLRLSGLMTMASYGCDEREAGRCFSTLRELGEKISWPGECILSMGMSGDYRIAIREGAHILRIGSAIFGARDPQ